MNLTWINIRALCKAVSSFVDWKSTGNFCIAVVAFLLVPLAVGYAVDAFIPIPISDVEFGHLELWLGGAFFLSIAASTCIAIYLVSKHVWDSSACDNLRERFYRERVELVWEKTDFQTRAQIEQAYLPAIYREDQPTENQDDGRLTLVESRHSILTGVQTISQEKT